MEGRGDKPPTTTATTINPHHRFFSSLKHLQQRLSSEPNTNADGNPNNTDASPFPSPSNLSSPLFLAGGRHPSTSSTPSSSSSPLPPEFLLSHPTAAATDEDDDVERLMGLLGLSPEDAGEEEGGGKDCFHCCSGDGFYRRVAGVKGPKGEGEMRRFERWIRHYRIAGSEPARLAYLLLGKVARSGVVEFPAAIEGHLECDPPGAGDES